jgi:hypothetical protein
MTAPVEAAPPERGANPVLWLVIGLPVLAVLACAVSVTLAVTRGDRELPTSFHWEGNSFDADQAQLAAAARLGISAAVQFDVATQRCIVTVQGAAPRSLRLDLTHPTDSHADRHVSLQGSDGSYRANCAALPDAHWWVQLADEQGGWMLRTRTRGTLRAPLALDSRAPAPALPAPIEAPHATPP